MADLFDDLFSVFDAAPSFLDQPGPKDTPAPFPTLDPAVVPLVRDADVLVSELPHEVVDMPYSEPATWPAFDGVVYEYVPDWTVADFDGVGTPIEDAANWHAQEGANSCAVVAQASVLEDIRGYAFDEQAYCELAEQMGWYDASTGTPPWAVGEILEIAGLECTTKYDATVTELMDALARGDKVIVGLNAAEIWHPIRDGASGLPLEQDVAGHAVWVTGVDTNPDGSVHVLLNDSGDPNGRLKPVEIHDFVNAWSDFGNFMVVTRA